MLDFEKLGVFYLGKQYDLAAAQPGEELLLYDAKDLCTHAVCVGMTGSGKTGLCLALLEEAAIDGIPAIAIDPKGDLGNLLLTFPDLQPADFQPWIDSGEATRAGCTVDEYAKQVAQRWRDGLAAWGQDGARIRRFRDAVDITVYTPGSNAGAPLTVLRSFAAPAEIVRNDSEAFRERVMAATSALLALLGVETDPVASREHILISTILDRAWREGRDLDLGGLIREIQSPPFNKIGVMDLENIFPAQQRFGLAMKLNNLLASPGFAAWLDGEPLDVRRLLHTESGQPRLSIISIAHLSDSERMFFVTSLLNEVVAWLRTQPGTSSLRALLYMDEVFGYFPPTANPPSKLPMLTLLKQARAFGLGVVLATQNPVDLDYKGLSNAGTWFLGRLQTERDKARVLDGLEGASTAAGTTFDRARMEAILAGLGNRVFLLNNVHDDQPVVFQTRWALSYLRGPLTRTQLERLMRDKKGTPATTATAATPVTTLAAVAPAAPTESVCAATGQRAVLPPGIVEAFLAPTRSALPGSKLVYRPALLGAARLHYSKASAGLDHWEEVALVSQVHGELPAQPWSAAEPLDRAAATIEASPVDQAAFAELPTAMTQPKQYTVWKNDLKNHLYRSRQLVLFECPTLKQRSRPGETEGEFRVRLKLAVAEARDVEVEKLRAKFAPKLAALEERIRKAQQKVEKEKASVSQQTISTVLTVGTTFLGAMFGRKLTSAANLSRATSSMRSAARIASRKGDMDRAEETVESLREQFEDLERQFADEIDALRERLNEEQVQIVEAPVRPTKGDLIVERVTLLWTPWTVDAAGLAQPAFDQRPDEIPPRD